MCLRREKEGERERKGDTRSRGYISGNAEGAVIGIRETGSSWAKRRTSGAGQTPHSTAGFVPGGAAGWRPPGVPFHLPHVIKPASQHFKTQVISLKIPDFI